MYFDVIGQDTVCEGAKLSIIGVKHKLRCVSVGCSREHATRQSHDVVLVGVAVISDDVPVLQRSDGGSYVDVGIIVAACSGIGLSCLGNRSAKLVSHLVISVRHEAGPAVQVQPRAVGSIVGDERIVLLPLRVHYACADFQPFVDLGLEFDAIYSGYLGSFEQLELVSKIFDMMRSEGTIVMVDPVMADNGKLYAGFDENFAKAMIEAKNVKLTFPT